MQSSRSDEKKKDHSQNKSLLTLISLQGWGQNSASSKFHIYIFNIKFAVGKYDLNT